jgi:hypothetical protein
MHEREGRLKPEYREWYPALDPETWYPAAWLSRAVLAQLSEGEPRWHPEPRVPGDAHFIFRGGDETPRRSLRTRRTDPQGSQPPVRG